MDDIVLLAIGRQFIEFAVRNEQLLRGNQSLNTELTDLRAKAKAEAEATKPDKPKK